MKPLRFYIALYSGKITASLIKIIAKDRGTNLPGEVALKIDPLFLEHVGNINYDKTVFITGTNGKSTSVNILNHVLTHGGLSVCCNTGGANMTAGVSVPLINNSTLSGRLKDEYILMEVDERYIATIHKHLPAKYVCITNLQKDQAQRNGEISLIADKVADSLEKGTVAILNRDDPNTYILKDKANSYLTYGVEKNEKSFVKEDDFFQISMPCPNCHDVLEFNSHNIENVGNYTCPSCGFTGEVPNYLVEGIDYSEDRFQIQGREIKAKYMAPAFLYCYSLAYAVAKELGLNEEDIKAGLESFSDIKGRVAQHETNGETINYIKMKQENSETLQSCLDYVTEIDSPKRLFLGFDEYLDFYPPYCNTFYLFDCDFRRLAKSDIRKWTCTSTALARAGAVRLCYDGMNPELMRTVDNSTNAVVSSVVDMDREEGLDAPVYMIEEIAYWKKRNQ